MLIYEDVCWSDLFESGGSRATVEPLVVTENGMYTAPGDVVYSPVTVDVSLGPDDGGDLPFEDLTWDQVIASTQTGKYKTFTVGAMKELDLGTEGIVHMQIVGIDADELADGSGYAPLTFISKELLNTSHRMNPAKTPSSAPYDEGTGAIGGWEKCEMRSYLKDTIKLLVPENVRNAIKNVTKYSNIFDTSGTKVLNHVTSDDVWIPSGREIAGGTSFESIGPVYTDVFDSAAARIKNRNGSAYFWFLRSTIDTNRFNCVFKTGSVDFTTANDTVSIALGFCL